MTKIQPIVPPPNRLMVVFIFFLLASDNPSERPNMGLTETFLTELGNLTYRSIGKTIGLEFIKIFPIEIFIFMRLRQLSLGTSQLSSAAKILFATISILTLYGIAFGGSVKYAALQLRPLISLVCFALYFQQIATDKTSKAIETIIVLSCTIRSAFGIYLWVTYFRNFDIYDHSMGDGTYVMSHSDSTLSVASLSIVLIWSIRKQISMRYALILAATTISFCALNNRRIFFIEIFIAILLILLKTEILQKSTAKARILWSATVFSYSVIGWSSTAAIFHPIQTIKSSVTQSDASSQTRGVENYNLIYTIRQSPLFGQGFGHSYIERIQAFDISHHFSAYLYVPHNSILWILSAGGIIFSTAFYFFFSTAISKSKTISRRNSNIQILLPSTISTYFIHCFGDMGAQCWKTSILTGIVIGTAKGIEIGKK